MEENINPNPFQETPESVAIQPAEIPETPLVEEEEQAVPARARSMKWFIIGGILIVFLAAAAFLGARLLKPPSTTLGNEGPGKMGMMLQSGGGPGGAKSVRVNMTPAPELPKEQPTTNGLFVRREDQSIFIGTGRLQMMVKKNSSGGGDASGSYDGPVVEIVINHQTKIYQDITEMTPPDANNNGEVTMKQVVKPGSLDDLSKNSMVSVWGEKQGDRYIAKVITFR